MNKVNQSKKVQDEDIDLFDIFELLWKNKWLIITMVMVGIFAGTLFIFNKEARYVSKINYTIETVPPFYEPAQLSKHFFNSFNSEARFNEWKKNSPNSVLTFEDFSSTEASGGFIVSKNVQDLKTSFLPSYITVNTNDLKLMRDYFDYCNFINNHLTSLFVSRAERELEILSNHLDNNLAERDGSVFLSSLSIDRFITEAKDGNEIFKFQHPTIPQKSSPDTRLILIGSSFLGFVIGMIFVIFRNMLIGRQVK